MIGRSIGRYRVLSRLGQGGIAIVWRAEDTLLGRTVALKILDEKLAASPKPRRRFLHEAQAAAALDHPGIVAVHDFGELDGVVYIALSLVEGETLSELAARRLLPVDVGVRIVESAAEALAHAHARGVIHRDITGRNLMVARDGRVVLLDFGLALAAWESRVTTTAVAMGTVPYMAPEVIQSRPADARSDLYGLGVVLYEGLTGAFPFTGEHREGVFYAATHLEPVAPRARRPELSPALERVVLKAIARDPAARYQTAGELSSALRALSPGERGPAQELHAWSGAGGTEPGTPAAPDAVTLPDVPDESAPLYVAVLPFETATSAADPEGVCATLASHLAETVSCALARAPGLRVVPPGTGAPPTDPRDAAHRLGANAVLRGSVRREGTQLRVAWSLLDMRRDVQIGGDVVDGSALQVFDVEDRVVASVSRALGAGRAPAAAHPSRPRDPAAEDHFRQALGHLKRYDDEASLDRAIALLERLIASEGDLAVYEAALARAFLHRYELTRERDWERRGASACARACELAPDDPDVQLALAQLATVTGRHEVALEHHRRVLRERPGAFEPLLGVARVHYEAARFVAAEEACRSALEADPLDWRGHSLLGSIYWKAGRCDRALAPFERVVQLLPDSTRGHRNLGNTLYRLDRNEEAVRAYQQALAIRPSGDVYTNLGTVLYFLGRHEDAIAAFRKATDLSPSDPIRWGNLGNASHWIAGRERDAEPALDRAIALMQEHLDRNRSDAEGWARLAGWLSNRGRMDEASAAIRESLLLAPDDVECMVRAAYVHLQLGDRAECLRWLRRARQAGYGAGELARSPELRSLRDTPGFRELLVDVPPGGSTGEEAGPTGTS